MGRYIIETPHSAEKCNIALYEILAKEPGLLEKFDWGCNAGVHIGWAVVEAESVEEVKSRLPSMLQSDARIVKLNKFTPAQIKSVHSQ